MKFNIIYNGYMISRAINWSSIEQSPYENFNVFSIHPADGFTPKFAYRPYEYIHEYTTLELAMKSIDLANEIAKNL